MSCSLGGRADVPWLWTRCGPHRRAHTPLRAPGIKATDTAMSSWPYPGWQADAVRSSPRSAPSFGPTDSMGRISSFSVVLVHMHLGTSSSFLACMELWKVASSSDPRGHKRTRLCSCAHGQVGGVLLSLLPPGTALQLPAAPCELCKGGGGTRANSTSREATVAHAQTLPGRRRRMREFGQGGGGTRASFDVAAAAHM